MEVKPIYDCFQSNKVEDEFTNAICLFYSIFDIKISGHAMFFRDSHNIHLFLFSVYL